MDGISIKVKSKQNFTYNMIIRDNKNYADMIWVADVEVQAGDEW